MTEKRRFRHWAYLNEKGRKLYGEIFPDGQVPLLSMIPQMAQLGGSEPPERVYMVYVEELSEEQFKAIVDMIAEKFKARRDEVEKEFKARGIPLRGSLVSGAGTDHPGLFLPDYNFEEDGEEEEWDEEDEEWDPESCPMGSFSPGTEECDFCYWAEYCAKVTYHD